MDGAEAVIASMLMSGRVSPTTSPESGSSQVIAASGVDFRWLGESSALALPALIRGAALAAVRL